jgi:hypothetical protein
MRGRQVVCYGRKPLGHTAVDAKFGIDKVPTDSMLNISTVNEKHIKRGPSALIRSYCQWLQGC